jgi:hypothetical protein
VKPSHISIILKELLARARHRDKEAAVHLAYLWRARNEWQHTKSPRIRADFGYAVREARAWDRLNAN